MRQMLSILRRNLQNLRKSPRVADETEMASTTQGAGVVARNERRYETNAVMMRFPFSIISCFSVPRVSGTDGLWMSGDYASVSEVNHLMEVKVIKNGRRFGYGTMDIGDTSGPSYATQSPDYKALYLETQTKLIQVKSKCDELSSQVEDALYWSTFMRNMYPDHVPPSKAARQAATADNTFEA
ncbi:hypothetical protein Bca52824_026976 [Brassica carinata]|uniref:Uncharacterized protein n=1 Tax=Brassica carinata TaxID=52824 RepID=A0A8X7SJ20_BRACI|nr:hypothetical protein Bca52824_026976 [Brassica carinata]